METEFNLSEKMFEVFDGSLDEVNLMQSEGYKNYHNIIKVDDVKEFIRLVKKNLNNKKIEIKLDTIIYQKDMIDKLAGDKLILK